MATDIQRLSAQLSDYHRALTEQRSRVGESHAELSARFRALNQVYDGTAAREFKAGWLRTSETFDAYVEHVVPLLELLNDKIEQLRKLDQST